MLSIISNIKAKKYKFSTGSIQGAINALKSVPNEGVVRTNEHVYDLLTLAKALTKPYKVTVKHIP